MQKLALLALMLVAAPAVAKNETPIVCEYQNEGPQIASIWPSLYLQGVNTLCFDVKGWPGFSGTNCVTNGKSAAWSGVVIVMEDGESRGRDSTSFRVKNPVVTDEQISYTIEWSRGSAWRPMQDVKINRLTGVAVSYFVTLHGGDTYQCHLKQRAL